MSRDIDINVFTQKTGWKMAMILEDLPVGVGSATSSTSSTG